MLVFLNRLRRGGEFFLETPITDEPELWTKQYWYNSEGDVGGTVYYPGINSNNPLVLT